MNLTLELDIRYHERLKEKGGNQEKNPPVTGSSSLRTFKDSSPKKPHHKKNGKRKNFQISEYKPHADLLNKHNKSIGSEKERRAYALISVENTQLKNSSRGLKIGLGNKEASLARMEKPE
ncbi:hypothetical protein O181_017055 [Austropuccinia psidii MF-1]|uniref:Uncharacterized protein n=1 Tax=Austropuccinia psidii MF-1 TaxID=1389203 RepID=A0A9Q3GSM4_9BASI|nr:hypothetical protein [Austropuccinia psidii MF-1]